MAAAPQLEALANLVAERVAQKLLEVHDDRPLLTPREVGERLGLSERTVRDMIVPNKRTGAPAVMPSVKIGGARRVEPRAVDELLRRIEAS